MCINIQRASLLVGGLRENKGLNNTLFDGERIISIDELTRVIMNENEYTFDTCNELIISIGKGRIEEQETTEVS